ncbi:MAG: hypothetical protein WD875_02820 [Pirellulales bacterium]
MATPQHGNTTVRRHLAALAMKRQPTTPAAASRVAAYNQGIAFSFDFDLIFKVRR